MRTLRVAANHSYIYQMTYSSREAKRKLAAWGNYEDKDEFIYYRA